MGRTRPDGGPRPADSYEQAAAYLDQHTGPGATKLPPTKVDTEDDFHHSGVVLPLPHHWSTTHIPGQRAC